MLTGISRRGHYCIGEEGLDLEQELLEKIMIPFKVAELYCIYTPGSVAQLLHDGGIITSSHLQMGKLCSVGTRQY